MNFLSEGRLRGSLRHLRTMLRGQPQALGLARLPIAALPVLQQPTGRAWAHARRAASPPPASACRSV